MTAWFHESLDPGERRSEQTDGKPLFRLDFNLSNLNMLLDEEEAKGLIIWLDAAGADSASEAAAEMEREITRTRIQMAIETAQANLASLQRELDEYTDNDDPKEEP